MHNTMFPECAPWINFELATHDHLAKLSSTLFRVELSTADENDSWLGDSIATWPFWVLAKQKIFDTWILKANKQSYGGWVSTLWKKYAPSQIGFIFPNFSGWKFNKTYLKLATT